MSRALRLALALAGGLAAATAAWATVPPPDPDFRPHVEHFAGPGKFCDSVLSIQLEAGETIAVRRDHSWASSAAIELKQGKFTLDGYAGGYASGRLYRRAGEGRLLWPRDRRRALRFDNGLPGTTDLVFERGVSRRKIEHLLARIDFVAPQVTDPACLKGVKTP